MENVAQVRQHVRANERGAVHDAGDVFQTCRDLDIIDGRVDRREGAHHLFDREAHFERHVAFRVEVVGCRHTAGHPEDDAGIGGRLEMLDFFAGFGGGNQPRLAGHPGGCAGGGELLEEGAAGLAIVEVVISHGDLPLRNATEGVSYSLPG